MTTCPLKISVTQDAGDHRRGPHEWWEKRGMTHTWLEKEEVLWGWGEWTPVSWSSKMNAICQIRWPDSLCCLLRKQMIGQVPFIHSGSGWTVSKKCGAQRPSWTPWHIEPGHPEIIYAFYRLPSSLIWQSPCLGPHPTDRLTHVHEDRHIESLQARF